MITDWISWIFWIPSQNFNKINDRQHLIKSFQPNVQKLIQRTTIDPVCWHSRIVFSEKILPIPIVSKKSELEIGKFNLVLTYPSLIKLLRSFIIKKFLKLK